jgi:tRNA (guanosine-2'-O-)-methyltransferase
VTVVRGQRTPKPPPTREELEHLEELTNGLPQDLQAYRDRGLLNDIRRFRIEQAIQNRTRSIVTLLDGIHDPHNQAAIMRTSEALGLQEVHIVSSDEQPFRPSPRITQNAHIWLDLVSHRSFEQAANILHQRGYELWAAGLGESTRPLQDVPVDRPIAFVFGNESLGLSEQAQSLCDGVFVIPLSGFSQSLNVSVAAALTLWWAVGARRRRFGDSGDLSDQDRMKLRRLFYRQAAGLKNRPEVRLEPGESEGP